jgi:2-polyprenyl-6-methoxyphenol hydroxylase-like FAD-dependent oxidoreductase
VVLDLAYADLHPLAHGLGIRRSTLFDRLHGRLTRSSARLVTAAEITEARDGYVVDSAGGHHGRFDLIIVADGAHSALRARLMPGARAPLYPWGCLWTTVLDTIGFGAAGRLQQRVRGPREMMGLLPVGRDHLTIYWSLPVEALAPDRPIDLAVWRHTAKALWPKMSSIIDNVGDFSRATYRHVALPSWNVGSTLFIGDAAHGTSPQLGQGANLGLLDAHALARSIAESADLPSALDLFARRRGAVVRFYRHASHLLTPFFQSRSATLRLARDLFMGVSCRVPGLRGLMTSTLAGVRRGWLGADRLDGEGRYRLASDAQRPGVRPKRATKWRVM